MLSAQTFEDQVSLLTFFSSTFFLVCSVALVGAVIAFGLIDSAVVRPKNVLDTWVQKLLAAIVAGAAFLFVGYAIWIWQYYQAGVVGGGDPNPLSRAISDWWLGGYNLTHLSQNIDPKLQFEADVFQVFFIFFATFMMAAGALLHGVGLERMKPAATYVFSAAAGGVLIPVILYLTWGSTSPLTNRGVHDYVGLFGLYIYVGFTALVLAWRLGPRLGTASRPDLRTSGPRPSDLSKATIGVLVLMCCIPWIALGCGFIIPGVGYVGISMTTSGFGIAAINVFAAMFGGGLGGLLLGYRLKNSFWAMLGPIAGYIAGTAMFDITQPWIMLLVAIPGPFLAYGVYRLITRIGLDETKVIPLLVGPGVYGALMPGIVHWGTKTGGFVGITDGEYAFQNAEINLWWQLVGLGVTVGIAVVSALVLCFLLEKTIGLRVSEKTELDGMDPTYWSVPSLRDADGVERDMPVEPATLPVSATVERGVASDPAGVSD
ncbi:hypothetical protein [Pseudonocardia xishanensis]|uniref:Ammonium transporter n=1 Tax=Pseudonocardia xishanensis TaxID=630995 RepID=A0ABP8RZ94_9PSEU